MTKAGIVAMSILGVVLAAPVLQAQDLSRYRQFQFGTRVPVVTRQAQASPSDVKVIHRRPDVIQELVWDSWTTTRSSPRS